MGEVYYFPVCQWKNTSFRVFFFFTTIVDLPKIC